MKVLVLNCGSSTLKFQLIEVAEPGGQQRKLARGLVDRIGAAGGWRFEAVGAAVVQEAVTTATHEDATRLVIDWLKSLPALGQPNAVGHRVVHGGERFTTATLIDDDVLSELESLCELAPLHNPGALSGIRAARKILGATVPMVAAFDTSFHHSLPEHAALYAIPFELSEKHKIRRYGFHGLAHQYDIARYAELTGKATAEISAVTLHLGNGCSATAIRNGRTVDTSMGFTPLEGLVMGTRSGDIDPALVNYLARKEKTTPGEIESCLNKRSGLLGVSGKSNDMRELTASYDSDIRARLAVDVFCYRVRKYLGAYLAALEGTAQAVIFSGGIGENSARVRKMILTSMEWCGIYLNDALNEKTIGRDGAISAAQSKLALFVIHTDEEAIIARETVRVLRAIKSGNR